MDLQPSLFPGLAPGAGDADARRALARYRTIALGLLGLMVLLTLGSFAVPAAWADGWARGLLGAAAKAGLVGGIADWFAVTALFRHPLGLPIPHTAIIPRQKARLGQALGRFVAGHVFTQADIGRMLARVDLPALLATVLHDPATTRPAARELAAMLPRILASVEDGRARKLIRRLSPVIVGGPGVGRVVARALRSLVEGGRHQEVLSFLIQQLGELLEAKQAELHAVVEQQVRDKGGRLVGWALGAQIADRVLSAVREEMQRMGPDDSPVRAAFDEWVQREILRMENDPERAAELGRKLRGVVAHDTVQAWLWDVWSRLRRTIEEDAARPDGRAAVLIEAALGNVGTLLATDAGARARLQAAVENITVRMLPSAQGLLSRFIADTVERWDAGTITERIELRVGRDLQWIRFNGTGVGFLVGGVVYALLRAMFGDAMP